MSRDFLCSCLDALQNFLASSGHLDAIDLPGIRRPFCHLAILKGHFLKVDEARNHLP